MSGHDCYARYVQRTGAFEIVEVSDDGLAERTIYAENGYSGRAGPARNNPAWERVVAQGPIPAGRWQMGAPYHSNRVGPLAIPLAPVDHDAHGRSGFRIHGDNRVGDASSGCIVLPRFARECIADALERGMRYLYVVPDISRTESGDLK